MLANINIHLGKVPNAVWVIIGLTIPMVAVLYVVPELRIHLVNRAYAMMSTAMPTSSAFPPNCRALHIVLPRGAANEELRLFIKGVAPDETNRCNPGYLRDAKVSAVTDVSSFRYKAWRGARAYLRLENAAAVIGVTDENLGGTVMALHCTEKPRVYMAAWGSFVPTELKLKDIRPSDDLTATCDNVY